MLQKLAAILREQFTRQKFVHAFRGASGVIDLASIMVGVLVIGIIAGVVAATVLAVIPWSQDAAARGNLDAVRTAESVSRAQDGRFLNYADLTTGPGSLLQASPQVAVGTDADGTCYISVATSDSGNLFFGTSKGPGVEQLTDDTPAGATSWCPYIGTLPGEQPEAPPQANQGVVTTLAGSTQGFADGTSSAAQFSYPQGVAVDSSGTVYVADTYNHGIRKITPAGVVTTLAGSGTAGFDDRTGSNALFNKPFGVAVDSTGTVYVADTYNHRIRKITPAGVVTTLAGYSTYGFVDGTGSAARFKYPEGVAVDSAGTVYVADQGNNRIRKITPAGVVTTLAGPDVNVPVSSSDGFADGTGSAARFNSPHGVAVDSASTVYVADGLNNRIRKITPAGVVTTLAGDSATGSADGMGGAARFNNPRGVAVDSSGTVYVADTGNNHRIRKITPAGVVTTLAGSGAIGFADGTGTAATFNWPYGVAVDSAGTVYVADKSNHRVRKIQ